MKIPSKNRDKRPPDWLANLVKETCQLCLSKGDIEGLRRYTDIINLNKSHCRKCNTETPTIECDVWSECAICQTSKL